MASYRRYNHWLWHSPFMYWLSRISGRFDSWLWRKMWSKDHGS